MCEFKFDDMNVGIGIGKIFHVNLKEFMKPIKHFLGLVIGQTTPQVVNFLQKKWTNK